MNQHNNQWIHDRVSRVIRSCKDQYQLETAMTYLRFAVLKYTNESFADEFEILQEKKFQISKIE